MQSSYWGYWLVVFGVAIVGLVITVNGITSTETQDYYTIKENVDASMLESIDFAYYRDYNEIKINKEKFMEVFIRKLPAVMAPNSTFKVNFYAIYEAPPKVSVEILSNSGASFMAGQYDTVTRIDAILQSFAKEVTTNRPITNNNSNNNGSSTGNNNINFNNPGTGSNTGTGNSNNTSNNNGSNTNTGSNNSGGSSGNVNRPSTGTGSNSGSNSGNNNSNTGNSTNTNTGNGSNTGTGSNNGNVVADTCREGIADKTLAGKEGVAMHTRNIYDNVNVKSAKITGTATPGKKFKILGESADLWAIEYDGKCGWVASDYMAINAVGYLPNTQFNITNASSSIYKTSGQNIAGLTGKRLYDNSQYNNSWVPITYSFAKKLKIAAENAARGGDTLVIMDAYRPYQVSQLASKQVTAAYKNGSAAIKNNLKSGSWDIGWFISGGVSTHNTGCAVDITLRGKSMPTAMHELSISAVKYKTPSLKTSANFSTGMANSSGAKALHNYMMSAGGISDLASEWWHYQDNTCHNRLKGSPSKFWSAV